MFQATRKGVPIFWPCQKRKLTFARSKYHCGRTTTCLVSVENCSHPGRLGATGPLHSEPCGGVRQYRVYLSDMEAFVSRTNSVGHRWKSHGVDCSTSEGVWDFPPPYANNCLVFVWAQPPYGDEMVRGPSFVPYISQRSDDILVAAVSIHHTTASSAPHDRSLLALVITWNTACFYGTS